MPDFDLSLISYVRDTAYTIRDAHETAKKSKACCAQLRGRTVGTLHLAGLELAALIANIVRLPLELIAKPFLLAMSCCCNEKAAVGTCARRIIDWNNNAHPLQTLDYIVSLIIGFATSLLLGWSDPEKNYDVHFGLGLTPDSDLAEEEDETGMAPPAQAAAPATPQREENGQAAAAPFASPPAQFPALNSANITLRKRRSSFAPGGRRQLLPMASPVRLSAVLEQGGSGRKAAAAAASPSTPADAVAVYPRPPTPGSETPGQQPGPGHGTPSAPAASPLLLTSPAAAAAPATPGSQLRPSSAAPASASPHPHPSSPISVQGTPQSHATPQPRSSPAAAAASPAVAASPAPAAAAAAAAASPAVAASPAPAAAARSPEDPYAVLDSWAPPPEVQAVVAARVASAQKYKYKRRSLSQ